MILHANNANRTQRDAWSLPELMVAVAVGTIALAAIGAFAIYGLRCFVAISNYVDLDEKSRRTVDVMTKELRQATRVIDFNPVGNKRWITLTNSTPGATVTYMKYTWSGATRMLYFEKNGQPLVTNLTECDNWEVGLYQRTPIKGSTNLFYPATNGAGTPDYTIAKLIDMKWKCSRTVLGKKLQTESVQTTQIVLRNKQ